MAQHRVGLGQLHGAPAHGLHVAPQHRGDLGQLGVGVRQEFVQRRIEQADRHRQPGHDAEQLVEILALERQQPGQRGAPSGLVVAP